MARKDSDRAKQSSLAKIGNLARNFLNKPQPFGKTGQSIIRAGQAAESFNRGLGALPERIIRGVGSGVQAGATRAVPSMLAERQANINLQAAKQGQAQPRPNAVRNVSRKLDPVPFQTRHHLQFSPQDTSPALRSAGAGVESLFAASGLRAAPKLLAGTAAAGAAIGGGLTAASNRFLETDNSVLEAVGRGVSNAPVYAGINPLTQRAGQFLTTAVSPTFGRAGKLAQRGVGGVVETLEDQVLTRASEQRAPTLGENLTSFLIGSTLGVSDPVIPKNKAQLRNSKGQFTAKVREASKKAESLYKGMEIGEFRQRILSGPGANLKQISKNKWVLDEQKEAAMGIGAGLELETDENGKITGVNFNEKKALAGMAVFGGLRSKQGREVLSNIKSNSPVLQRYKSQIGEFSETGKPFKQHLKDFYTDWINRFQPIDDITSFVEKSTKSSIRPEFNPSIAIKRLLGAGGKAELRHNQVLKPILDELGDISKGDFDVFLKAKRDIELGKRGIIGSDPEEAGEVVRELSKNYDIEKMDAIADQLYTYQRESLENLRESGFLSKEAVDKITSQNEKYVPFERIIEQIDNYIGLPTTKLQQGTSPIKTIKGSTKKILSPMESIIANTYKTEAAIAKNRVAKSIVGLKEIMPDLNINQVKKSGKNTISVWEDGKKNFYEAPEDVIRAVKGLNEESVGTLTKVLSAPARLLRQQATGRNLEFMIPNTVRDQFDAAINSEYGYRPFIDYFDGLRHWINFSRTGSDDIVESWMNSGGSMFFENMGGRKQIKEQIQSATQKKRITKRVYDWVVGGIESVGDISEKPTRIGLFKRGLKKTGNPLLAAVNSRESTLDFARMGAKMKTANMLTPFLNVGVQGFDRMIRTAKKNPGKASVAVLGYGAIPATATALYNNLYHAEEWARIPDFEKEGNFIVIEGTKEDGTPNYIKIPKSHLQKLSANPVEELITHFAGNNPQSFGQFALNFFADAVPILQGGSDVGEVASKTVGANLPQFAKPLVEQTANFDFFRGRPIVPKFLEDEPASEQAFKTTDAGYKKLGEVFNLSPLRIKHALESTLAGGVSQPKNLFKSIDAIVNDKPIDRSNMFIIRRFLGDYADFDNERPERPEGAPEGFLARLIKPSDRVQAAETLPTTEPELKTLYKQDESFLNGYQDKVTKIKYGNDSESDKAEKLGKLDEEYVFAKERQQQVIKNNPELAQKILYEAQTKLDFPARQELVLDQITQIASSSKDRTEMLKYLAEGRRTVNKKKLITDDIIDAVARQGLLSRDEVKQLKAFSLSPTGQPQVKITGRGSGGRLKKIKVLTAPKLKVTGFNVRPTGTKLGRLNIKPTKLQKITL